MPTATPFDDAAYPTVFKDGPQGKFATVWYKIDHDDPVIAVLTAAGLPEIGDPYSPGLDALKVVERGEARRWGGRTIPGSRVGWCICPVRYQETAAGGAPLPELKAGTKWTEVVPSVQSQTVLYDVSGTGDPINNGDGVPRQVGQIDLAVSVYQTKSTVVDYARLFRLHATQAFNQDAVTLPPVYGDSAVFTLAPETAQFGGVSFEIVGQLRKVTLTIKGGLSRKYPWYKQDSKGRATGPLIESPIYPVELFAGLPGIT